MVFFKKIAAPGKYHDDMAIYDVLAYITRKDKTPSGHIFSSDQPIPYVEPVPVIATYMRAVARQYGKYSHIHLHHFILTFKPDAVNLLPSIANDICDYIGRTYQVVVAQHEDTPNPHLHVVFNSVSFVNGYKYHGGKEDYYELINQMSSIVHKYGLHPLIPVKYIPNPNSPHE